MRGGLRRLIPAHAGKTRYTPSPNSRGWAHPRSRGENLNVMRVTCAGRGSSPLTRGKLLQARERRPGGRLIPAHAGKTRWIVTALKCSAAHPRSRGENLSKVVKAAAPNGSSPLTRGKQAAGSLSVMCFRLIPAHAGKTPRRLDGHRGSPAHPRSRGENSLVIFSTRVSAGSSPLTRGKLRGLRRHKRKSRLIPAHAGKTLPDLRFYCADRSDLGNP